jgi:hypothetical protein
VNFALLAFGIEIEDETRCEASKTRKPAVEEERKTAFRASIKASADEQEDFFLANNRANKWKTLQFAFVRRCPKDFRFHSTFKRRGEAKKKVIRRRERAAHENWLAWLKMKVPFSDKNIFFGWYAMY